MPHAERGFFNPDAWVAPKEMESRPKEALPLADVFASAGISLSSTYREMLMDSVEHRYIPETAWNNRKGSGLLQATREIGDAMRSGRRTNDVRSIAHRPLLTYLLPRIVEGSTETRERLEALVERAKTLLRDEENIAAGRIRAAEMMLSERLNPTPDRLSVESFKELTESNRYETGYELDRLEDDLSDVIDERLKGERIPSDWWKPDPKDIDALRSRLDGIPEGERLVGNMLLDLANPREVPEGMAVLPHMDFPEKVGTCTTAEVYFLDAITRDRGYSSPDYVVDEKGEPVMILKTAGERSAMTLVETVLDGVRLPKGSLVALTTPERTKGNVPFANVTGVQFLRLTSLAVTPENRAEAIGSLLAFQRDQGMKGCDTASMDDFMRVAKLRTKNDPYDI